MLNKWVDIEKRTLTNPRYVRMLELMRQERYKEFIRGIPPFGNNGGRNARYSYGYDSFYFVANVIVVAFQKNEFSSSILDAELLDMTKNKDFSVLALRYVSYYLVQYQELDIKGKKLWKLDYNSIISSFNEQQWIFEDKQLDSFRIKLCESINYLNKAEELIV